MSDKDYVEYHYGTSSSLCDYILEHQLQEIKPQQIVDFGAGAGKVGKIARQILDKHVRLIAVEGSDKTAQMLSCQNLYDEVCHTLIQEWDFNDVMKYDLAIFGDVLEHLTSKEIHIIIKQCIKKFKHIIVICPLHDIFKDEAPGNPLEIHNTYMVSNFFDHYNPIEKHIVRSKEWTIMNVYIRAMEESVPIYRSLSWFVFHKAMLILQPFGLARPFVNVLKRYARKYKWLLRD
jgi:NADPH:quinone reductase-like Zn-dependent oxidoreductase